jgi:hypothetical protein
MMSLQADENSRHSFSRPLARPVTRQSLGQARGSKTLGASEGGRQFWTGVSRLPRTASAAPPFQCRRHHQGRRSQAVHGPLSVLQDRLADTRPETGVRRYASGDQQRKSNDDCHDRHQRDDGGNPPPPIPTVAPTRWYHSAQPSGRGTDPGHQKGETPSVQGLASLCPYPDGGLL